MLNDTHMRHFTKHEMIDIYTNYQSILSHKIWMKRKIAYAIWCYTVIFSTPYSALKLLQFKFLCQSLWGYVFTQKSCMYLYSALNVIQNYGQVNICFNTLRPRQDGRHFLNQWRSVYRRIYASLGLNELTAALLRGPHYTQFCLL